MDFGRLGLIHDPDTGRRRTVWTLIVVLGYSRHSFVWPTHGQKLEDVIADAARVRHPKDKPKVERGVPYVRERFFKGGDFEDLSDVREQAQRWCREVAELRIHGTTHRKPLMVFQDEERETLIPWNGEAYEIADWRNAKVHQDHHIQCRQALYSVPAGSESGGQGG